MWARMPITSLVADEVLEDMPERMDTHLAQPWDCSSRGHSIVVMDRISSSPWMCKIGGEFYKGRYMFTVDYTDSYISDDPAQHKQSHVLQLIDADKWTGNIVALPNNRVRVTNPAYGLLVKVLQTLHQVNIFIQQRYTIVIQTQM